MTVNDSAPSASEASPPIWLATEVDAEGWIRRVPLADRAADATWGQTRAFRAEPGRVLLLPAAGGGPVGAAVGLGGGSPRVPICRWRIPPTSGWCVAIRSPASRR